MIRIHRSPEPTTLPAVRTEELARVRLLNRQPLSDEIGIRYQIVRDELWNMQGYKCCYCEFKEQRKRNDVEHYRPKARANRSPGSAATHGYWWLAWTWENLLFSCRNCNEAPAKLDKFPLDHGSVALTADQPTPGGEKALLIDPTSESGINHIQFRPAKAGGRTRWVPTARGGSAKGKATIETCLLDRDDLVDLYTDHVTTWVEPRAVEIEAALASALLLAESWSRAIGLLAPTMPFAALSFDVLDQRFPEALRSPHRLQLPIP